MKKNWNQLYQCNRWMHNTNNKKLQLWRCFSSFGDRAFAHTGPHAWNSLLSFIRATNTLPVFKKMLYTPFWAKVWRFKMTRLLAHFSELYILSYFIKNIKINPIIIYIVNRPCGSFFCWGGPPDPSVSSLILVGWWEEGHPATENLLQLSQG